MPQAFWKLFLTQSTNPFERIQFCKRGLQRIRKPPQLRWLKNQNLEKTKPSKWAVFPNPQQAHLRSHSILARSLWAPCLFPGRRRVVKPGIVRRSRACPNVFSWPACSSPLVMSSPDTRRGFHPRLVQLCQGRGNLFPPGAV